MTRNYKQIMAINNKNKQRLLKVNPALNDNSGIYILKRTDENGIKFAYIGQARKLLERLCSHMTGYQHIDLSLKKHGLYSVDNPTGWNIGFIEFPVSKLDEKEQYYIKEYANLGYQLRNKTAGGQGEGKSQIDEYRPAKGYRDGLKQGYINASREVAALFDKHLTYSTQSNKPNSFQLKAMDKFKCFLEAHIKEND